MTDLDLLERRYVSLYANETVGLSIYVAGAPTDADNNAVTATMRNQASDAVIFSRPATRTDLGTYTVALTGADTGTPGLYSIEFSYSINGIQDNYVVKIEVGSASPAYDALPPDMKDVVESVWARFADLFDSPAGGPHLQVYLQSKFGRGRVATLLSQAIGRLNTVAQPRTTYSVHQPFPYAEWGPLLEQALYVEVIKHLIRSYTEQPEEVLGVSVSRLDRRDYQQRWLTVLSMEQEDLNSMMDNFKMAHMGLGGVRVLVSGGAYGKFGPTMPTAGGQAAARGYLVARRYL